jgi:exopolyphosphatase/guanosine-5'-triphosphate,3'-diphosphate pyrophosphatase
MSDEIYASVDLGSNTFRLLVAEADETGIIVPGSKKVFQEITRLSEGLVPGEPLGKDALKRSFEAIEKFHEILLVERPIGVLAGATMAARLASDGEEFLKEIERRYGWETKLLSGPVEAYLAASGVLSELEQIPDSALIFDIGGRSTEFISFYENTIMKTQSLDMGVVGLTEDHIKFDPPTEMELVSLDEAVLRTLQEADWRSYRKDSILIGTAGTVTTIAAMILNLTEYSSELVNNLDIPAAKVQELFMKLSKEPLETRKLQPGLHPGRADVIIAGLIMVIQILRYFNQGSLLVSDNGLLEGLFLLSIGVIPLEF